MAVTANRSYPYPVAGDPPAGHTQIQALANAVDVDMQNVDRTQSGFMTADQSATSNTTLANLTGMSFTMVGTSRYAWQATIFANVATAGDLKFGWTVPVSATVIHGAVGLDVSVTTVTGATNFGYQVSSGAIVVGGPTGATNVFCVLHGTCIVGVNPGTFQLQFAQGTSSGTATVVRANSYIIARRLTP